MSVHDISIDTETLGNPTEVGRSIHILIARIRDSRHEGKLVISRKHADHDSLQRSIAIHGITCADSIGKPRPCSSFKAQCSRYVFYRIIHERLAMAIIHVEMMILGKKRAEAVDLCTSSDLRISLHDSRNQLIIHGNVRVHHLSLGSETGRIACVDKSLDPESCIKAPIAVAEHIMRSKCKL